MLARCQLAGFECHDLVRELLWRKTGIVLLELGPLQME